MEENIKILEGLKTLQLSCSIEGKFICTKIPDTYIQALENLIKGYWELEKENKELMEVKISASADYRIRQLEERNRELEEREIWSTATITGLKKDFISKSKIKEKIEELCKEIDKAIDNSKGGLDEEFIDKGTKLLAKKQVLQELMEDK